LSRSSSFHVGKLAGWFAVGVFLSVGILCWFGYHAIFEWRRSSVLLAERRTGEAAELLVEAVTRDMRGAQQSVLTSPHLRDRSVMIRPYEISSLVANAFARYPYPESFFVWNENSALADAVFFNRSDRAPSWKGNDGRTNRFPVVIEHDGRISRLVLTRILQDAERGREWSAFEIDPEGTPLQIIASLTYGDIFRRKVSQIVGFTVSLPWVEQHYFADLTRQVWEIGADSGNGLTLSVTDGHGRQVAGPPIATQSELVSERQFSLMFFDPDLVFHPPFDEQRRPWTIRVSAADDASLLQAMSGANRTLMIGAASAVVMAIGLLLTVRAERENVRLAELRSDFVSTVTHELKTPIATIRVAAETLSKGRLTGTRFRDYGRLVNSQAKRLGRLVENLLAYARITDVADVYAFEPLQVEILFKDIQQEFEAQLDEAGFDLQINIQPSIPPLRGDRLALRLLFDNLIDNSVKYSERVKELRLSAAFVNGAIEVEVADSGIGIPPEEINLVQRKFVRGTRSVASGSGIGLAIATRIAADHGGALRIGSIVDQGTTIVVRLPAAS